MSGQKVTKSSKTVAAANGSVSAIMKKAFKKDTTWEDKDEFLDVIYWFRQILAILLGIVWGILPLKGILAIGLCVICILYKLPKGSMDCGLFCCSFSMMLCLRIL
ncbi:Respirasome Complex Assembly Factor 1 [Acropora cervicornis]|uniref:Respirasome Complex Assembly Factor 1 n=1 Tax=Acropora cervicornis TaxID=6130 RepID=A0AAD9V4E8_ACRCE|nr:Respirasome Complex Assembly Factor 1 [Acropora cervicornis]